MKKNRRQFLVNTSLATISATVLPSVLKGNNPLREASASSAVCDVTTEDLYGQGPFYTANAPEISGNLLAPTNEPGERLIISGRVQNLDCTELIEGAIIDIWHADDAGDYDNIGFKLRGKTMSNSQGFYMFETIVPGKYLNGSKYRPSHIHFKITPPGYPLLTTQLYFEGDPDNATDAAASVVSGTYDASKRIIPITLNGSNQYEGTWDIVVDGESQTSGTEDLRKSLGMIYQVSPNPISNVVQINYGVFQQAKVSLSVFDMNGRTVAELGEKSLSPEKYTAQWNLEPTLAVGYYFIALRINDVQVHYLKVLKQD